MDIVKKARAGAFYLGNKDKVDEIVEAYHAFGGIEGVLGVIKGYPKKELEAATKEETTLKERKALRVEQEKRLNERLKNGWKDEAAAAATAAPKANGAKK